MLYPLQLVAFSAAHTLSVARQIFSINRRTDLAKIQKNVAVNTELPRRVFFTLTGDKMDSFPSTYANITISELIEISWNFEKFNKLGKILENGHICSKVCS